MIPDEAGCGKVTDILKNTFLQPENSTVGIIGIVGDFFGSIENLPVNPKTGYARKISEYMVLERDDNDVFRHPLYILFLGDDQAVLSAMEKSMSGLEACGLLDESNPYHALYFSEYGPKALQKSDLSFQFDMGYDDYNAANYDVKYIVRGVEGDDKSIDYPTANTISETYQTLLKGIHVVKLYTDARGNTENNVTIRCTIPYVMTDSATKGEQVIDKHELLVPAKELALSEDDYTVSVEIQELDSQIKNDWMEPEQTLVRCESTDINVKNGTVTAKLSVNSKSLQDDDPVLFLFKVRVQISPKWEELESIYDTGWINDWSLNLKEFDKEFNRQSASPSSARFTYATTAKTPFLYNLLYGGIADQQTGIVQDAITSQTLACTQTGMFGIVVRDYPAGYVRGKRWDEENDFDGWAFSMTEVKKIMGVLGGN